MRHPGEEVMRGALQHKLGIEPNASSLLVALFRARYWRTQYGLSEDVGCTSGCVKVYVVEIRKALGAEVIQTDRLFGYQLSPEGRDDVRAILQDMLAEVNVFLSPLLEAA